MNPNNDKFRYFEKLGTIRPRRDLAQSSTLRQLSELVSYEEIAVGEAAVRQIPIVGYGYGYCKDLILLNKSKILVGGSHLLLNQEPEPFLEYMLERMGSSPRDLKALVLTTGKSNKIEVCCRKHGIDNVQVHNLDGEVRKDIITIPSLDQVFVHSIMGAKTIEVS